jgi:hypothetical protein
MTTTPSPAPAPTENHPEPVISGTFALYVLPDGRALLTAYSERTGDVQLPIPKMMVRQAVKQNPALGELLFGGVDG